MNRLTTGKSAYLIRASHQKVDWYPWTEEAFEQAMKEDKPVFLSTGAAWCHWCHVMAKESFEDEETAGLMNELFVNVKLDRDERPDIDRRYQQAVAAMGGGSGWPLSVFLTPDKQAFYGGTYFPPDSIQGRPSFKSVLKAVSDFYKAQRGEAVRYAERVAQALRPEPLEPGMLNESALVEAETAILARVDQEHGGFGTAPKFPTPGAIEFLLRRARARPDASAGSAVRKTLLAMAAGGFHDQLGGGFHRYSVDDAWTVPHFEKMAEDNAGLLRNYADGYALFGDRRFRDVAADIIAFTRDVLSDPEGGFYASQDADVTPDDEGGYFTWTDDEFRAFLDSDEYEVLSNYLLHEKGSMHHDHRKKVLFTIQDTVALATVSGRDAGEVMKIIGQGKNKLMAARAKRETPFIDRTLYTSINGMMIAAFFHAYSVFGDEAVRAFGMKSLDRILRERRKDGLLLHSDSVPAGLDDYVHLIDALTAGHEAAAEKRYLEMADHLMGDCLSKFYDAGEGGFFDTEEEVLGLRMKRVEDIPHPSANAVAVTLLLKLSLMTGKDEYRKIAEQSLAIFLPLAREIGVHAGAYYSSLDALFNMIEFSIEARPDSEVARAARFLGSRVPSAIVYGEDRGRVIVCSRDACFEPAHDRSALEALLRNSMAGAGQRR